MTIDVNDVIYIPYDGMIIDILILVSVIAISLIMYPFIKKWAGNTNVDIDVTGTNAIFMLLAILNLIVFGALGRAILCICLSACIFMIPYVIMENLCYEYGFTDSNGIEWVKRK